MLPKACSNSEVYGLHVVPIFTGSRSSNLRNGRRPTSCIIGTNAFEPGLVSKNTYGSSGHLIVMHTGETPNFILKIIYWQRLVIGINGKV